MATDRQIDPLGRRAVLALAAGRAAIGIGALVATRPALRVLGFPKTDAVARALAHLAGGRDLALAALAYVARDERDALRRAVIAAAAVDATDAIALGLGGRYNRELRLAGSAGAISAGSAALIGAWAWLRLGRNETLDGVSAR
jgi:hypothetical protein